MDTGIHTSLGTEHGLDVVDDRDGLDTRVLRAGDELVVQTAHSVYTLAFVDPELGEVEASGSGNFINEHVAARLLGTTLSGTGTALRRAFVMPGFKLALRLPEGELMTSRVRRIFLNGASVESSKTVH